MIIYIDKDYKCYTAKANGRTAVEAAAFDGKCAEYIEGYRFVPAGETWVREDGVCFYGEMVSPWKPYDELERAQIAYEKAQYEAAIDELLMLI